jgi:hypothetical protein
MSELKEHLFCECDEIVREYRGQLSNEMRPYYLKSEADKVIADMDCEIKKLKDSLDTLLKAKTEQIIHEVIQNTLIYGECFIRVQDTMKLIAELRHNKYKRCLAMARACDASMAYFGEFYDDASKRMVAHYYKWRGRWYELAERFEEAHDAEV